MDQLNRRVVILAEKIYEDLELWYPLLRLKEAGATVVVAGKKQGEVYESKHGYPVKADVSVESVDPAEVDAVIIPGGYSPDHMRRHPPFVELVRKVHESGSVVAFICHGGWVPASAGILHGKKATGFYSIKDDLENAGAVWEDKSVVRDGNLISSRNPGDLPDFCRTIIDALS